MGKPTFQLNETVVAIHGHWDPWGKAERVEDHLVVGDNLNMGTLVVDLVGSQYTERGFELPSEIV